MNYTVRNDVITKHSLRNKVVCVSSNQMAPDYDHLTLMQKVEVFEHALSNTNGDDLAKLLWLKSPSSEVLSSDRKLFVC